MAGPSFDVVASLTEDADEVSVSFKVVDLVTRHGLGVIFGVEVIRRLDPDEGVVLDELARGVPRALVFTVTSNPLATDASEVFETQLNVWAGAKPDDASFLSFLRELCSISEVREVWFTIWDSMSPSLEAPRHEMDLSSFLKWIGDYYRIQLEQDGRGGAQGIFRVQKSGSSK